MRVDFNELVDTLQQEYRIYQKIYELGQEKQQIIIKEDADRLSEITKLEEEHLTQISSLEKARESLTGGQTISQLLNNYNGSNFDLLNSLRYKLSDFLEVLKEQNALNDRLLDDALKMTNLSLNILTNNNGKSTYGKDSKIKYRQNNIINKRA